MYQSFLSSPTAAPAPLLSSGCSFNPYENPPAAHQVSSSPQDLLLPQHLIFSQTHNPGSDHLDFVHPGLESSGSENVDWRKSGPSCFFHSDTVPNPHLQNQNQDQNQFIPGGGPALSHSALFDTHPYEQASQSWDALAPPLGPDYGDLTLGNWTSQDFFNQDFCSRTSPGPSPQYQQPPSVSLGVGAHHTQLDLDQNFSFPSFEPGLNVNHLNVFRDFPQAAGGGGGGGGGGGTMTLTSPAEGGGPQHWTWVETAQSRNSSAFSDQRLSCTMCSRVFKSLPALNGHMRSHCRSTTPCFNKVDEDSPLLVQTSVSDPVMPVCVPVRSTSAPKSSRGGQRRRGVPFLAIGGAAVLYRSLMHLQQREQGDGGDERRHYTPPPMLCPLRAGPGLHRSITTTTRGQRRAQTVQNRPNHPVTMETQANQPKINVGRSFQAEVPPLRHRRRAQSDPHNAHLLWTPWEELEEPVNQKRAAALLLMVRSSVVPGGGASPDHALSVLSESRGDFLETVEKLLSTPPSVKHQSSAVNHFNIFG